VAAIELDRLTKIYADGTRAVHELSLEIDDGEFVVFVGPSGCGKTSALRMVAGLEEITGGAVRVGGKVVNDLPPKARDMAMVFQNYALYPHMNVYDNMAFGLKMRGIDRGEIKRRVDGAARILGLAEVLAKKPRHLSGGQRQRVAMGRAIVREPQAFLMDEPLSNLDAKLRVQMRASLAALHDRLKTTTVYVTHDQVEAMTLGDRVAVLRDGVLQQVDTPQNLYNDPANLFVAAFIGSPPMNLVEAQVTGDAVSFAGFTVPIRPTPALRRFDGRSVILGIRPSDIEDTAVWSNDDLPSIDVRVDVTEELGSEVNVLFSVDAPPIETEETKAAADTDEEEEAFALISDGRRAVFCARVDARTTAKPGSTIRLSLDPARFHYFDPQTGAGIEELVEASARA
jgi:multiple sugar transport system ATP-binding protein